MRGEERVSVDWKGFDAATVVAMVAMDPLYED